MRWVGCLVLVAGCGRVAFDPRSDGGDGDGAGDGSDGPSVQANLVFVTRAEVGVPELSGGLAGLDTYCTNTARAAGHEGMFVAWASTSTVNARDRFPGSRGWVRTDGHIAIDDIGSLVAQGRLFSALVYDEAGARVTGMFEQVLTGTQLDGTQSVSCADWTGTGTVKGGLVDRGYPEWTDVGGTLTCSGPMLGHLYCLGIGLDIALAPPTPGAGDRIIFASATYQNTSLATWDNNCNTEATMNGLQGTYRAALATTTGSIASRFVADSRSVRRIDGALVARDVTALFDGTDLEAHAMQSAAGVYLSTAPGTPSIHVGAPNAMTVGTDPATCSNWTSTSATFVSQYGRFGSVVSAEVWGGFGNFNCMGFQRVLCLQE